MKMNLTLLSITNIIADNLWIFIGIIIAFVIVVHFIVNSIIKRAFNSDLGDDFDKPFKKSEKNMANRYETLGFVRSFEPTGVYLNEQPKVRFIVDVLNEHDELFTAEIHDFVLLTELSSLEAGMPMGVIYDLDKPEKIAFSPNIDQAYLQDLLDRYEAKKPGSNMSYEDRVQLRQKGQKALAHIKQIDLTGNQIDDNLEATVDIEITTPENRKIDARRTLFLQKEKLKSLQVGQFVDVLYIPNNENKFAILFNV